MSEERDLFSGFGCDSPEELCIQVTPKTLIIQGTNMIESKLETITGMADNLSNGINNEVGNAIKVASKPSFIRNIAMAATNIFARGAIKAPEPVQVNPSGEQPGAIVQTIDAAPSQTEMEKLLSGKSLTGDPKPS